MLDRSLFHRVQKALENFPIVAIIGPRQCGKSTLSKQVLLDSSRHYKYLDLERPSDLMKLDNAEFYLQNQSDYLVCLDEIQRKPDLFPLLRSIVDLSNDNGQFLILGSASPELIRQSSESLAGRVAYIELAPFSLGEVGPENRIDLWVKGGFPRSFLARDSEMSYLWRENFVSTFLEKDIPNLGFTIAPNDIRRLWQMLAHSHGQILNQSTLARSLGTSHVTVKKHVDILVNTFMLRYLEPYHTNFGKRIIKAPKVYLRDTGILHYLLGIEVFDELVGNPILGASWEGVGVEHLIRRFVKYRPSYLRTSGGAEVDLILEKGDKRFMFEFKVSNSPSPSRGFYSILGDLKPNLSFIVSPIDELYEYKKDIYVGGLHEIMEFIEGRL